jgi:hypothetical protein
MDESCPGCTASLKGRAVPVRLIPEGTPFYRAKGRSAVCPSCRTPIRRKKSRIDDSLFSIQAIGLVLFVLIGVYLSAWALVGLAIFVVAAGVRIWHARRFLKQSPRWELNEHVR